MWFDDDIWLWQCETLGRGGGGYVRSHWVSIGGEGDTDLSERVFARNSDLMVAEALCRYIRGGGLRAGERGGRGGGGMEGETAGES